MSNERINLDAAQPAAVFADVPARRITGLAIPADGTAEKGGRTWRFLPDSVRFGDRTPLLAYHDTTRPVGRLTEAAWTDRGLEVHFSVSRTTAGDEILQLAADGVLGLSVGIDVPPDGARLVGEELHVSTAHAAEVSVTPCPAFSGAVIDAVTLSNDTPERTAGMPDNDTTTPVAPVVNLDAEALGRTIGEALMAQATTTGPIPTPVPVATAQVTEEAPYRFDGRGGRFGFVADCVAASQGDGEANTRLTEFLRETFVTGADVAGLNPARQRPDLYSPNPQYTRPLAGLISTGTINDGTPFILPRFGSAANLVNPHVEGVEPTLGTFTATSQTITPGALSGKVEITREVWDARGNPQVDQLVWQEMLQASAEAAEERIAAMLDGLAGVDTVAVTGTDDAVVGGLTNALVALQFQRGGNRFSSLALNEDLYTALIGARDTNNRALLPILGPTNADGSTDANFGAVRIGNAVGVPTWGLSTNSYLLVPGSVYQWMSAPQKLVFDVQVKSVYVGLWVHSAEAVIREGDVKRISYAAA